MQVKSKKRVADHGEVYTSEREVNAMLDLVKHETERIDSRFLEPACGNGNFLVEVLRRKLAVVTARYAKSQIDWEYYAFVAVSSLYGVDILPDNVQECVERLFALANEQYCGLYPVKNKDPWRAAIRYLLTRNILWGDALDYTHPQSKEPIVFSEWTFVTSRRVKRRDYQFKYLVKKSHQFTLFNDRSEPAAIDLPVRDDYAPLDYLTLGTLDT